MAITKERCPYCGEEIVSGARKCRHCGEWLDQDLPQTPPEPVQEPVRIVHEQQSQSMAQPQPVIIQQTTVERGGSNGAGTAGFIFALLAILFSWAPLVKWLLWFLGALFSFIGLFKRPRGLAVAGFFLSIIGIILIVAIVGVLAALLGDLSSIFD